MKSDGPEDGHHSTGGLTVPQPHPGTDLLPGDVVHPIPFVEPGVFQELGNREIFLRHPPGKPLPLAFPDQLRLPGRPPAQAVAAVKRNRRGLRPLGRGGGHHLESPGGIRVLRFVKDGQPGDHAQLGRVHQNQVVVAISGVFDQAQVGFSPVDAVLAFRIRHPPAGHEILRAEGTEAFPVGGHVPHSESAFVTQHGSQILSPGFIRPAFIPADDGVPRMLSGRDAWERYRFRVKRNRDVVEGEERSLLHHLWNGGLHRDAWGGFETCPGWRLPDRKLQKA